MEPRFSRLYVILLPRGRRFGNRGEAKEQAKQTKQGEKSTVIRATFPSRNSPGLLAFLRSAARRSVSLRKKKDRGGVCCGAGGSGGAGISRSCVRTGDPVRRDTD